MTTKIDMECPCCGEAMEEGQRAFVCTACGETVDHDDLPDLDEIQDLSVPGAYEANAAWRNA